MGIAGGLARTGARAIGPPRPNLPAAAARGLGRARRLRAGASTSSATNEARAGEDDGDAMEDATMEHEVWEHRTGHVMVPAKDGLLVIGGLAYNGEFQNDVQHIRVF